MCNDAKCKSTNRIGLKDEIENIIIILFTKIGGQNELYFGICRNNVRYFFAKI